MTANIYRTDSLGRVLQCQAPTCERPLPKGRRSYCSDQCAHEGKLRGDKTCEGPGCDNLLKGRQIRFCGPDCRRKGQRAERTYDPGEIGRNVIRLVHSMSRRGGRGGEAELAAMWGVMKAAESACVDLIDDLQASHGATWESMAEPLGITRQGLYRWAHRQTRVLDGHAQEGEALAAPGVNQELTGPAALEAGEDS